MGLLSGIGDAISGVADAVTGAIGGIAEAVGGITDVLGGFMNSPLGGLIAAVFPPAGAVMGGLNMLGMATDLAQMVAGGEDY
ncbi:MAG: hypothetical protein AAGA87_02475 [Pseudomonadota bacterium]